MTIKQAFKTIQGNWDSLLSAQLSRITYGSPDRENVIWVVNTDHADSYETDEEWLGIKKDGTIVWAYASGCSCWGGDYEVHETHDPKEIKSFTFNHEDMKEEWEKKVIEFAENICTK